MVRRRRQAALRAAAPLLRHRPAGRRHPGARLFRWSGLGWKVNPELPGPPAFDEATSHVREEDIADSIVCGDDVDAVLEQAQSFADAGFTHLSINQIGGDQQGPFLEWTEKTLLPAWREAFGS